MVDVEVGRVRDCQAAIGSETLEPEHQVILILEKARGGGAIERYCLGIRPEEVTGIKAGTAPFVVSLPGVGTQLQQYVSGPVLVGYDDEGDIEVAQTIRLVDEIDRIVAGPP